MQGLLCSTLLAKAWRTWDAGCLATVSQVLTVKPRSPLPPPKHGVRPPVTRLSASLADGLEVVSIDSMLNRHRPAEINHTCLIAGQNMVSQNVYEFSDSRKYRQVGCQWLGLVGSLTENLWRWDSSNCWSLAVLHGGPALVQRLSVFVMKTISLAQTLLTALHFSHYLSFHLCSYSFVCSPGIDVWASEAGVRNDRFSKRPAFEKTGVREDVFPPPTKLNNKEPKLGSKK